MCKQTGTIFNIQRFSTGDGPGIRTVVFLKGCPLNCQWCHNPESKSQKQEIFYKSTLCIGCGGCTAVCPTGSHVLEDGHAMRRDTCTVCGRCVGVCPTGALELCGEQTDVDSVMQTVLRDKPFYDESGGGITLSGGEPLAQYDFSLALLKEAKRAGLHTAIETCGFSPRDLAELAPYVDLWLFDIKLLSDDLHRQYTGVSNERILHNLRRLEELNAAVILRCPIIPQVNMREAHIDALAALAHASSHVREIHLEPYHPLGISKSAQLGRESLFLDENFADRDEIDVLANRLREQVSVPVIIQ